MFRHFFTFKMTKSPFWSLGLQFLMMIYAPDLFSSVYSCQKAKLNPSFLKQHEQLPKRPEWGDFEQDCLKKLARSYNQQISHYTEMLIQFPIAYKKWSHLMEKHGRKRQQWVTKASQLTKHSKITDYDPIGLKATMLLHEQWQDYTLVLKEQKSILRRWLPETRSLKVFLSHIAALEEYYEVGRDLYRREKKERENVQQQNRFTGFELSPHQL